MNKTTNNNIIIKGHEDFKVETSKSIPTDTKNKTEKTSLIGRASEVAGPDGRSGLHLPSFGYDVKEADRECESIVNSSEKMQKRPGNR